ncbi:MAG: ATP-binding protein, partial [Candidatus Accumulibacter sp.]|nr:ATP-binding protein [Accumulibacter sp.]
MERTFRELRKSERPVGDCNSDWEQCFRVDGIGWAKLLKSSRILLVSEAGAGKTYECQKQASSLFDQGKPAFFLPLENVATGGIASALYGQQLQRFRQWLTSSPQVAYFFLDSIDELQLAHGSFKDALKRLAHDLDGLLGRATIVLTSRPVAIDRQAFKSILPVPVPASKTIEGEEGEEFVRIAIHGPEEKTKDQPLPFIEVELLPLTDQQIIEFSGVQGVTSPKALLSAIDAKHARDFARRPQDLIEICDDWREHGNIRSHFKQVENHVHTRLVARLDRKEKADLSIEKALHGARQFALVAILSRRLTIRYSAGADREGSGNAAIDPRLLLQDWTVNEIAALLERPIFIQGGYGRVRFHHRSVIEYLAACQIHQMIESGILSVSSAKRLIFGLTYANDRLLKPSMRPVAGWLSLLRKDIFDAVLETEPSTLLVQCDPESLTDLQRERALLAFTERYGKGQWRGLEIPNLHVARLAQPTLSDTILSAWHMGVENPEVRDILLRLISAGRFQKCADLAFSVARDVGCGDHERFEALVALANIGDVRIKEFIESAVAFAPGWTERMVRWIGAFLYPEHVSDAQLLQLLSNVQIDSRQSADYANSITRVIEKEDLTTSRLEALLPGLLALTRGNVEVIDGEVVDRAGRLHLKIIKEPCPRHASAHRHPKRLSCVANERFSSDAF